MKNQVQLITYPDSLGGNLPALRQVLEQFLPNLFSGVHILPPYPSSGDRGFAPLDYFQIDPRFGTWQDIRAIAQRHEVLLDLMVNHVSRRSGYFQDFAAHGRASPYANLFLTLDKIWPEGEPNPGDVARVFLRRPVPPFADISIADTGAVERVWATFGTRDWSEQIDLDVSASETRSLLREILAHLAQQGVRIVRLDAIAFVIKKPGTNCFFVEPEIYGFIDWMQAQARVLGIQLLLEVHAEISIQKKLAAHGDWTYDFALPLLVLHTLFSRDSHALKAHLWDCPRQQVTTLDSHDGIPVQPDIDGLLSIAEAQRVVQICLERGANLSRILSVEHRQQADFDAHQINIPYFSALGADENAYLAARAIQFFTPGVPQVYYVGLLAGENDLAGVEQTGEGRAINRHNYSLEEIRAVLDKPVVQRLLRLIRFRNDHPAFSGEFAVLDTDEQHLGLEWRNGEDWARLQVDLLTGTCLIQHTNASEMIHFHP